MSVTLNLNLLHSKKFDLKIIIYYLLIYKQSILLHKTLDLCSSPFKPSEFIIQGRLCTKSPLPRKLQQKKKR